MAMPTQYNDSLQNIQLINKTNGYLGGGGGSVIDAYGNRVFGPRASPSSVYLNDRFQQPLRYPPSQFDFRPSGVVCSGMSQASFGGRGQVKGGSIPMVGGAAVFNGECGKETDASELRLISPVRSGVLLKPFQLPHDIASSKYEFHLAESIYTFMMGR